MPDPTATAHKQTTSASGPIVEFARKYAWDVDLAEADALRTKVILRVMDYGTYEDTLQLEEAVAKQELVDALTNAPPGALRPRSWSFWRYRLGLVSDDQVPRQSPRVATL